MPLKRRLSFIIPAYNESFELPRTLTSIRHAAGTVGLDYEVIVVDDASTDDTVALAQREGATVIPVHKRQIAAVRNAGAQAAQGDVYFFVDADTRISASVLQAALDALDQSAVGGGAWVDLEGSVGWVARATLPLFNFLYMGCLRWAAGCFVFAQREAFWAAGGFDESLFACEEIVLSQRLKKVGRFCLVRPSVLSSGRKMRQYSLWRMLPLALRFIRYGFSGFRSREGMEWWYEGKRETQRDSARGNSAK